MKKESNLLYIVIVSIIVTILVALLIIINVNGPLLKDKEETTTTSKVTTTKRNKNVEEIGELTASVMIEGMNEYFKATIIKTHIGFTINYDKEYFKVTVLDNAIIFENLYDPENFIKVENLENNFSNDIAQESIIKGDNRYLFTYKYMDDGKTYLKITKCLNDNSEYEGLSIRMDYIIDSLIFNND